MTQFLTIQDTIEPKEAKKTVLTHQYYSDRGWIKTNTLIDYYKKVVYLGNCRTDGDMFACYHSFYINICKGIKGDEFNNQ